MTLSYAYPRTANDRLKDGFELRLALSFMAAVVLHTLVFELWPAMEVAPWGIVDREPPLVVPLTEYDLPPDPEPLSPPAVPVPSATAASVDPTLPWMGWDDVVKLPAPNPSDAARGVDDAKPFISPHTVRPSLLNEAAVQRVLQREYPTVLREAGIGGTVYLLVHIDALGDVLEARVDGTSGMASLDAAALRVADAFRFRPALNRDRPVEVWIRLPVTFQARDDVPLEQRDEAR